MNIYTRTIHIQVHSIYILVYMYTCIYIRMDRHPQTYKEKMYTVCICGDTIDLRSEKLSLL